MESRGLAKLTAKDIAELTVGGLQFFSPDQLAFLFSVGKIELKADRAASAEEILEFFAEY